MDKIYKNTEDISILHVNTCDNVGGAARFALSMHAFCCQRVKNSWLAVGRKRSAYPNTIEIPNDIYRSSWKRSFILPLRRRLQALSEKSKVFSSFYKKVFRQPHKFLKCASGIESFNYPGSRHLFELVPFRPNILHFNNLHGAYFDLRVLPYMSNNTPTIITLHDAWLLSGSCVHSLECEEWRTGCEKPLHFSVSSKLMCAATAYNWRQKRDIYSKSKLYIATPSKWLMQKVEESILAPAIVQKRVIPNGVDLSIFAPGDKKSIRRSLNIPADSQVLLFISDSVENNPWRDYNMIEEALIKLSKKGHPKSLTMICVGAREEKLIKISKDIEIHILKYKNEQEDMAKLYQSCDLFIFPSKADTFPLSILEAMACGVPVIATAVGGIPEQLQDAETGFLIKPGDACGMAERILELLSNVSMLEAFGRKGYETVKEKFSFEKQANTYLSWYRQILENK